MFTRFDPKKFLGISKDLLKLSGFDFQAKIRTSIGRAYYSVFLTSYALQKSRGHKLADRTKIHQLVIDSFHEDHLFHIADKLDILREFRRNADYSMSETFSSGDGDTCIKLAENIFKLLTEIG